jgi:hypothetical protein
MQEDGTPVEQWNVLDATRRLFILTDEKDWNAVRSAFTPTVHFDMTSLAGGAPQVLPAETIVQGWEQGLQNLTAVHHQTGNELVTVHGDQAHVFCYGIALHHRTTPDRTYTRRFVGSYDLDLVKVSGTWKISGFTFHLKFIDGDVEIPT